VSPLSCGYWTRRHLRNKAPGGTAAQDGRPGSKLLPRRGAVLRCEGVRSASKSFVLQSLDSSFESGDEGHDGVQVGISRRGRAESAQGDLPGTSIGLERPSTCIPLGVSSWTNHVVQNRTSQSMFQWERKGEGDELGRSSVFRDGIELKEQIVPGYQHDRPPGRAKLT
jgi:hypothetical protein